MWHLNNNLIKSPRPITIGDVQYPAKIFTNWSEAELNKLGIFTIKDVRVGTLVDNSWEWSEPAIDFAANTRTFTATKIPKVKLDKEKAKKLSSEIEQVKQYANQDIIKTMASWKQRNMITVGVLELAAMLIEKGIFTQAEIDARPKAFNLLKAWDKVVARRTLSDEHEQSLIDGSKTISEITEELYPEPKL